MKRALYRVEREQTSVGLFAGAWHGNIHGSVSLVLSGAVLLNSDN